VAAIATARSFLFAPGSDPGKLRQALASDADAVVADLEDGVVPAEKTGARETVADALAGAGKTLRLVRVNGAGTPWHEDDLAWVAGLPLDGIVLPKATPDGIAAVTALGLPVVAIAETPDGVRRAYETASVPGVAALMLGAVDLGLALGLEPRPDGLEILYARSSLVLDAAAARIRAPIDRVWTSIRDADGLEADCRLARSLGLRGKACIHPAQIAVVNAAFTPSSAELERARSVVDAFDRAAAGGSGAVAFDGEMIDLPVVERARQLLTDAEEGAGHGA
jgi:citrate lyase subunit beta / citryl-CoA lyase